MAAGATTPTKTTRREQRGLPGVTSTSRGRTFALFAGWYSEGRLVLGAAAVAAAHFSQPTH